MLSDAPLYNEHRSMQMHDTELFISSIVHRMNWNQQEQDVVMDIGCGPGNIYQKMLLPSYPRVNKVIGIDVLEDMIEFAKKINTSDKIEYHVADIGKKSTIEKWAGQITKVLSIHCFNWLDDQEDGFRNVYHIMKPGGEAALVFVLSTPFWDSYKLHIENPKYSKYLKNGNFGVPKSHYEKHDASYYRDMLERIGFNVIVCEDEDRAFAYPNEEDCRASIYCAGLTKYVPDELKSEFKEELFQGFLKFNGGRNPEGKAVLRYTALTLLIQKPN